MSALWSLINRYNGRVENVPEEYQSTTDPGRIMNGFYGGLSEYRIHNKDDWKQMIIL